MRSALLVAALAMMVCGFTGCSITSSPGGNGSCDGLTAGGCDSFASGCDGRVLVARRCGGSCTDCAGGHFLGHGHCRTIASPGLCGIGTKLGLNGIGCSSCGDHGPCSDGYHAPCRDACGGRFAGGLGFGCGGRIAGACGAIRSGLGLGCGCDGAACDNTVACDAQGCDGCDTNACDSCLPAPGGFLRLNRGWNACDSCDTVACDANGCDTNGCDSACATNA